MTKDDPGYITDLAADTSYGGYLGLEQLLAAQRPRRAGARGQRPKRA